MEAHGVARIQTPSVGPNIMLSMRFLHLSYRVAPAFPSTVSIYQHGRRIMDAEVKDRGPKAWASPV